MPQLIIGLGTGRCGTTSLARLLNAQTNAYVSHEFDTIKPRSVPVWAQDEKLVLSTLNKIYQSHFQLVGDIGLFHLPYVELIAKTFPEVRFICLRRSKRATVQSFMKKTEFDDPWRHTNNPPKGPWSSAFPKFNALTKRKACEMYWEYYYQECDRLQKKFPNSFFMFNTEDLNTYYGVRSILTVCNIPEDKQSILFFHENRSSRFARCKGALKHYARVLLGNASYERIKRVYYQLRNRKFSGYTVQPVSG